MRKLAALAAFLLAAAAPPQDPPGMRGPDDPRHPRAPKMPAEHKSSGCCEENTRTRMAEFLENGAYQDALQKQSVVGPVTRAGSQGGVALPLLTR